MYIDSVIEIDPTLALGIDVIRQEAKALGQLADRLDDRFVVAVERIAATRGRVVVAGIGKSGHIGRKLAATLAATGSGAFFVHAAEAGHGDLGMIAGDDTVIVLTNSGTTRELIPVIHHARRVGAVVIAITASPEAEPMRQVDIVLTLPAVDEACPEGVSPSTSTAMMLALGDALALAAMRRHGTSRHDILRWHPGGAIGWRLSAVDILIRADDPLPLVTPTTSMRDTVIEMTAVGKGVAGVIDDSGRLIGIVTDGDLRRAFDRMLTAVAGQVMTAPPLSIATGTTIESAATALSAARVMAAFVLRDGRPVGLVHIHDLSAR